LVLPLLSVSNAVIIFVALIAGGIFLFSRRLSHSSAWRATITPLASIMGSGFLVSAPLLYANVGNYAVLAMAGLLLLAYAIGSVIRFNIQYAEPLLETSATVQENLESEHHHHAALCACSDKIRDGAGLKLLEKISYIVLAGSYCISVSYYLQLLASFSLHSVSSGAMEIEKVLVTAILAGIGGIGAFRGLKGVENVERFVVGINLAMIASLIAGLIVFNMTAVFQGSWSLHNLPITDDRNHTLRILMGLLIVVQGFETSRFLGTEHTREERIRTMRFAQIISSVIYLVFIGLMALVMSRASGHISDTGITAIIALSGIVALILPFIITITAIGSQFSAATADDAGCAGLMHSFFKRRTRIRFEYIIVSVLSIALTWMTDVYEIISIASRAFALYYALQCFVAIQVLGKCALPSKIRFFSFAGLGLVCLCVALFGIPAG
jgi:hypothetical protein